MTLADSLPGEMNPPLVMLHMEPKMDFVPDDADYISPLYKTGLRAGVLSTTGTEIKSRSLISIKLSKH